MDQNTDPKKLIRGYFAESVHDALSDVGLGGDSPTESYVVELLVEFLHRDRIYAIRDEAGRQVQSVTEMLAEGDMLLNADSFAREREVHKHIGDFLLFWSGLFPEFLKTMVAPSGKDALLNCVKQGQRSYYVASTFNHQPYDAEAPTLRRLSEQFVAYQHSLSLVRASFEGFRRQGWLDGFCA